MLKKIGEIIGIIIVTAIIVAFLIFAAGLAWEAIQWAWS